MDWPTAIGVIGLPVATFIVSLTVIIVKAMKTKSPNGIKRPEFEAVTGGIRNEMVLTRDALEKSIEDIKQEIRKP